MSDQSAKQGFRSFVGLLWSISHGGCHPGQMWYRVAFGNLKKALICIIPCWHDGLAGTSETGLQGFCDRPLFVAAWPTLPLPIRTAILTLLDSTQPEGRK